MELLSVVVNRDYQKDIMVVLLYRQPQGNIDTFITQLRDFLHQHYNSIKQDLIILGDFNMDYRLKKNPQVRKLLNLEKEFLLNQIIDKSTRVNKEKELIIDLIFTNIKFVKESKVIEIYISDHFFTGFIYKKKKEINKPVELHVRDMSEENITRYKNAIKSHDW